MKPIDPAYHERVIQQGKDWVNGQSNHNVVDDECCPDFSCCIPDLFETDRAKRMAEVNRFNRNYGYTPLTDD